MNQTRTNAYGLSYLLDSKMLIIQNCTVNGINLSINCWGFWTAWPRVIFWLVPSLLEFHGALLHSCIERGVLSIYTMSSAIYLGVMSFFWSLYFMTAQASILFIFRFVAYFSPLYGLHLHRNLDRNLKKFL